MSLDFGRKPLREEANDEAADRRRDWYEPQSVGTDDFGASLARQSRRTVARKAHEENRHRSPEHQREQLRRRGSDDAEQKGVENEAPLAPLGRGGNLTSESLDHPSRQRWPPSGPGIGQSPPSLPFRAPLMPLGFRPFDRGVSVHSTAPMTQPATNDHSAKHANASRASSKAIAPGRLDAGAGAKSQAKSQLSAPQPECPRDARRAGG